jgi:hypothetical protein
MENIVQTVQPFFKVARIFGLFPMVHVKNHFKVSKTDVFYSVLNFLCLSTITFLTIFYGEKAHTQSKILATIWRVHSSFGLFLVLILFFIQMKHFKVIGRLVLELQMFDEKVKKSNCN